MNFSEYNLNLIYYGNSLDFVEWIKQKNLDLTFGQLTISCQKAANQRGKEFLFDYRLYLRKCSWGRKITIKMQIPLGAGTGVQIRTRKNRIIWGQYVEPNISKPIRETHEQR